MNKIIYPLSMLAITLTLILCTTKALYAVDPGASVTDKDGNKIVEAVGEVLLGDDTTPAQGKAMARNNARRNALEHALGVQIHGSTVLYNSSLISDLVVTATKGLIIAEELLEDRPIVKADQVYHFCKLKATVKPINIEKRGNFKILKVEVVRADSDSSHENPVFQDNDEIRVRVRVNEDAYINIFSVSQDGMISKLLPNDYFKSAMLAAKNTLIYPDDIQRALGLKLRVKAPKKQNRALESVLVIATKEKADLLSDGTPADPTLTDLLKMLSEIDPSLWAESTVGYEVRK
ncbi:MAG: DUF4384 domain-containing protein [Nitrospirae bacterium]|nr:DUF4384 domain-containing protein [Nitrospirota bacterium]